MKIGLMGAWNTDAGASIHSELIGRSFVELGHELVVFTFFKHSFHGTEIVGKDESYVTRCFTVFSESKPELHAVPFLVKDYEIFLVEDLGMLPQDLLGKIFHRIRHKAKTVNVIHDGNLREDPTFYQFKWDAIVCFDKRYYDFLKLAYPQELIYTIPYPCLPWKPNDKAFARQKLGLPQNKKIILLFGPSSYYGAVKYKVIKELARSYKILILVLTKNEESLNVWKKIASQELLGKQRTKYIEIRKIAPPISELYEYLYAADALFYNKSARPGIVTVASTAFQCLGSGCPIIALKSTFVETLGDTVYKYKTDEELKGCFVSAFEKDSHYKKVHNAARRFVEENSRIKVAKKFLELFEKLKREVT